MDKLETQKGLSISRRLTISLIIVIASIFIIIASAVSFYYMHTSQRLLNRIADEYIFSLTEILADPIWEMNIPEVVKICDTIFKNEVVVLIDARDNVNKVQYHIEKKYNPALTVKRSKTVILNGEAVGTVSIVLTSEYIQQTTGQILFITFFLASVVLVAIILLTGMFLRLFLEKPLHQLKQTADAYANGTYDYQDKTAPCSEFGPFVDVLHQMGNKVKIQMKALETSEAKFRSLYENAIEGIFQMDSKGHIIDANPSLAVIFKYDSPQTIIEKVTNYKQHGYVDKEDAKLIQQTLLEKGELTGYETRLRRQDQTVIWILLNVRIVPNEDGQAEFYEGSIIDITERVEKERVQLEKEAAELAALKKSTFLASMSHEIRTPINAIIGLTDLVQSTRLSNRQRDYLEKITRSAQNLLGVVNDILDFSRIEAGRLDLEKTAFQIEDIFEDLSVMVAKQAALQKTEVIYSIDPDVPFDLIGDPLRLGQILTNLVTNAVKFTQNGKVIVYVSVINSMLPHVRLKFQVKDTGIGIPDKQIPFLFDSFSQVDISTTRKYGGSGLGLAICKYLVEKFNGSISVTSQVEKGSVFIFDVEMRIQSHYLNSMVQPNKVQAKHVLVVDDNKDTLDAVFKMLPKGRFKVSTALTEKSALNILKAGHENRIDLVMIDSQMPGVDVYNMIEAIRKDANHDDLLILLMMAYDGEDLFGRLSDQNYIDSRVVKPIQPRALIEKIEDLFSGSQRQSRWVDVKLSQTSDVAGRFKGIKILLVEDDKINQQIVEEVLAPTEIAITIAENGEQAAQHIMAHTYDAVLMDVQLPVMNGYMATENIRHWEFTQKNSKRVPIIAMTANLSESDIQACLDSGMDDVVKKPVNMHQLVLKIAQWIGLSNSGSLDKIPFENNSIDSSAPRGTDLRKSGQAPQILPGIDIEDGLYRLRDNWELYKMLLIDFKNMYQTICKDIEDAYSVSDYENMRMLVHKIKGVAGNIAATRLHQAARQLEANIKAKEPGDIDISLKRFEEAMDQVMLSLDSL